MVPAGRPRPRISIEERAERRARLVAGPLDRYAALLRFLQAGQQMPLVEARRRPAWPPLGRLVLRGSVVVALGYLVAAWAHGLDVPH